MPPIQCVLLGGQWPVCEINYSPPPSAEVTNEWRYISTPPYVLTAWTGKTFLLHELVTIYKWSFFIRANVLTCLTERCVYEIIQV